MIKKLIDLDNDNKRAYIQSDLVRDLLALTKNELQRVLLLEAPDAWAWEGLDVVERAVMAIMKDTLRESTDIEERTWDLLDSYVKMACDLTRTFFSLESSGGERLNR